MTSAARHIVVLTSCTGLKASASGNGLTAADFALGPAHVERRERRDFADQLIDAERLYRGQQHLLLMRGVDAARATGWTVDVHILSAGYGLVDGQRRLAPYECTFDQFPSVERRRWARHLGVRDAARHVLAKPSALKLVLLGESYLAALEVSADLAIGGQTLVFCAPGSALKFPPVDSVMYVPLGRVEARRFSRPLVALKGEIGRRLLVAMADRRGVEVGSPAALLDDLAGIAPCAGTSAIAHTLF